MKTKHLDDDPMARLENAVQRQATEEDAEKALRASRTKMLLARDAKSSFFSSVGLKLELVPDWERETIATDGERLVYNPDFVMGLTPEHRLGVLAHEVMHIVMKHHARQGARDVGRWNAACDLAINPLLIEAGYRLQPSALFPGKGQYASLPQGKSAEEYYSLLPAK